jgi:hypothetical protein
VFGPTSSDRRTTRVCRTASIRIRHRLLSLSLRSTLLISSILFVVVIIIIIIIIHCVFHRWRPVEVSSDSDNVCILIVLISKVANYNQSIL